MTAHHVLVVQPLHPQAIAVLDARPDVSYTVVTDASERNLLAHIADVEAITIRDARLPGAVVDAAGRLKVISRHGVGYDSIPIAMCTARGIPVTVVGTANTVSVAEHAMYLLLAAARAGIELDAATRHGDFAVRQRVLECASPSSCVPCCSSGAGGSVGRSAGGRRRSGCGSAPSTRS